MNGVYPDLAFPDPPEGRPYVLLNMVSTIDGKIVTGTREEPVQDLGSETDHLSMRQIQQAADGVLIGAGTLRSTPKMRYPLGKFRFVASRSGAVDPFVPFFTEDPQRAFVVAPVSARERIPEDVQALCMGEPELDYHALLKWMRNEMGIRYLLSEGGSHLNGDLFRADLVDEVFLTVAPKVKCGDGVPTVAGGEPLPRGSLRQFRLVGALPCQDEVFLRYRRIGLGEEPK